MDPAILAAIIGGGFAIIAAITTTIVSHLLKKKKSKEEEPLDLKIKVQQPTPPPPKMPTPPEGIPTPPAPYFAHPYPLQENFTGRLKERQELTEWFTKGSCPMFAYVAIGGMGKSALTWFWLQEDIIKKGLAPEGIIWWSFYDQEARFETFLMKAIQYVGKGEIDPKEIRSTWERMRTLYNLVYDNRFLLVLDGVERLLRAYAGLDSSYQGDEVRGIERGDFGECIEPNVSSFLQSLASGYPKTKTLLTSRLCPKELDEVDGCLRKNLEGLDKEDAIVFFYRQGVMASRGEIESACDSCGYHPLSLRLLSGMVVEDAKYMGDIAAWSRQYPLRSATGIQKERHILEVAYNSLNPQKRTLVSKLSAFRSPMDYDSISIFNEFETQKEFDEALIELVDTGLLLRDAESNKYDLHPIVRKYCYDRLTDKEGVHSQLRDYFASVPEPEKVESLDDLAPVIELYHHAVSSGRYDEALDLFYERIDKPTYYQFGAYNLRIDLLRALFPDGEDKPPRLKKEDAQSWTLNELANSYSLSGQPKKATLLLASAHEIDEKLGNRKGVATVLGNLAHQQLAIGDLTAALSNLRRRIDLCQEIKDEFREAVGHQELGRLLAYQGKFEESEKELRKSLRYDKEYNQKQGQSIDWGYRALRAFLMSNAEEALKAAKKARGLADVRKVEADIIRAEWLLGAAHLAKGDLEEAEEHLNEALVRDRRINLVEFEPDILLELAKLRFAQGHKEEALKLAEEALGIADRCEYRLKQADIHNFLTEFYLDAKDFPKAKEHVEKAKERAECGYGPAMKKAEELARRIEKQAGH